MIWINGAAAPSPAEFSVEFEDVGDMSRRNALGQRLADRVAVKRIINVRWAMLEKGAAAKLMEDTAGQVFFEAKYHDPFTGAIRTGTFRAARRSAEMHRAEVSGAVWANIEMKWEER